MLSTQIVEIARNNDIPVIDVPFTTDLDARDFLGDPGFQFYDEEADGAVPVVTVSHPIEVGDTVLMEVARGWVETVIVDEVVDGIVYGSGDDGEPFCAPLANCDKVPY